MKTRYKFLICFAIVAALLLGGVYWYQSTYIQIEERILRRDINSLTLTETQIPELETLQQLHSLEYLDARRINLSLAEYEQLKTALPTCHIDWNIPFQGSYLAEDTEVLTVISLTEKDMESIAYLPALRTVNAEDCRDYEALLKLQKKYPDLEVHYTVKINDLLYREDTATLSLHDADVNDLRAAIPYLPQLEQITLTGIAPDSEVMYQMMCDYPQITFQWNLNVFGLEVPNTSTQLILSGIPMDDTSEVESYLKFFPNLERIEMCDCGIPSSEMDALSKRWPDIRFVWTIQIGRGTIRTDAVGFIPWKFGYDGDHPLYDKDVTELKYCIDMLCLDLGHMKIQDISFLHQMPKLKYLIVGELPCPDFSPIASLKELIYLEIFNTTFTNQEILLELPQLQDLNMGSTKVYGTEVLKQMTWLKRLWLAGTGLTFAEYDELVAALPDTQVVMHIPHSTAGGWRDHQNYRDMRDLLGMFYME